MKSISTTDYQILYNFFNSATSVSDELLEEISIYLKKKSYKKGDFILKSGDVETKSNILVKGVVHQYIYDEDEIVTINITPKGLGFNSLRSYVDATPSLEIHEAITDVEIFYIQKKDLEMLSQKNHELSYLMFKVYEKILLDRENRMLMLQYRNPSKRYALFLEIVERAKWILEDTQDKYIASYLNMTSQQYSKEKKKAIMKLKKKAKN